MRPVSIPTRSISGAVAAAVLLASCALAPPAHAEGEAPEDKRLEIHGYGEIHYNNPQTGTMSEDAPAEVDVHRLVLGWEYEFTPSIRMSAEVDFEHSATEIELEYAHVECDLTPTMSFRAGSLLMPVGPLNEFHEPPTYHSVERSYMETYVLPTTWQDIGLGIVGRSKNGALAYRVYVVSGLDATGFSTAGGIRGGRQHGAEAKAEDLALVGRFEYAIKGGFTIGTSGYVGGADQGTPGLGDVGVTIVEGDVRFRRGAFDLRTEFAGVTIGNSDSVSIVVGEPVGSNIWGVNSEAAFDLINGRSRVPGRALWLFARYEQFDTNGETEPGITPDPAAEREVFTTGISYRPVREVALKTDVEFWKDGAGQDLTRLNVGAAFQF